MIINKISEYSQTTITEKGINEILKNRDIDDFMGMYTNPLFRDRFIGKMLGDISKNAIIEVSNVFDYIKNNGLPSGDLSITHVPFHNMWVEWKGHSAVLFMAQSEDAHLATIKELEDKVPEMQNYKMQRVVREVMNPERNIMFVNMLCFFKDGHSMDVVGMSGLYIDIESGEIFEGGVLIPTLWGFLMQDMMYQKTLDWIKAYRAIVASVIKFMNCKNVLIKTNDPPSKLQKNRKRKNKPPLYSFKTIEIRPIRILKTISNNKSDIGYSLHICRGHFKDYTKGKGLFGRIHGSFWWEEQMRGDIKHGISEHDYKVSPA